jgi:hypothetical protein
MGVARAFIGDFCGRCGAAVFLPEGREGGGGVGCGGGVAGGGEWGRGRRGGLGWDAKVSFGEEAVDAGLVRMLERGGWRAGRREGRRDDGENTGLLSTVLCYPAEFGG